jgi:hypothetical protein
MTRKRLIAGLSALAMATSVAACGGDDEDGGGSDGGGDETASAEVLTVTTADVEDGYSWAVEPTPTAETKNITYVNDSEEDHALIFARINEGYTLEEAYELQGEKGSAEMLVEGGAGPGETAEFPVKGEIEPGNYAMLCPIPGHYQKGQLEEFEIE